MKERTRTRRLKEEDTCRDAISQMHKTETNGRGTWENIKTVMLESAEDCAERPEEEDKRETW